MRHSDIRAQPPVLVDVGASGSLPELWRIIAEYSICLAFDADTREFEIKQNPNSKYKKLFLLNRLIAKEDDKEINFFLTESPFCSSTLKPNTNSLKCWAFHRLFAVKEQIKMPSLTITGAMQNCNVSYIDWYKTDTQGTDLSIFNSLPANIKNKILVAEFEPGIIDAYHGEDKLHNIMCYMEDYPYWITKMDIKGSQWICENDFNKLNRFQKFKLGCFIQSAPGWCEISYMNRLCDPDLTKRDYLLGWVFATLHKQHGFALQLSQNGFKKYNDRIFCTLSAASKRSINTYVGYIAITRQALSRIFKILKVI